MLQVYQQSQQYKNWQYSQVNRTKQDLRNFQMDFSLNRDKKNTAETLPVNLLIKITNATLYKVDLDSEGLQSSQVKRTSQDSRNEFHKSWNHW